MAETPPRRLRVQAAPLLSSGPRVVDAIAYGEDAPDADAATVRAATVADAHGFVTRLPGAYLAAVGDDGATLSGGQRARVALARALRKPARAFLLDEPTAALDAKTEGRVLDGVVAHAKATGATLVLVAHARSAVAKCDFATVLEDGAVVESGPYAALAADPNSRLNAALDAP